MKLSGFLLLSLSGICMGKNHWKVHRGCDRFNSDGIRGAVTEAVTLAETALDVLNNHFGDDKVQKMVKYILGDDQNLQSKVDRAKELFGNVNKYEKKEYFFLGEPLWENTDVMIYCDDSNYGKIKPKKPEGSDKEPEEFTQNKAMGRRLPVEAAAMIVQCYNAEPGPNMALVMGITTSSDGVDYTKYQEAIDEWERNGSQGREPDLNSFSKAYEHQPNTMDLCTWYLNRQGSDGYYTNIDDATIARVQEQTFLDGLSNHDRAIDALATSLAGTLLHELTHTTLGGKAWDNPAPTGCYGWVCVGNLHDANNADSISQLGVCMHLFTKGFWVDVDGKVKKI